jgi:cytochrome c biogenesis protein CcdA/thiol-disulfide isomerase/thioredoxin
VIRQPVWRVGSCIALLVVFAFLAGAGTAVSPCVLPVLPALLSAGATGGRRRPIGIVLGLATTFTITIVGFAKLVDGVGLGASATRDAAIIVLAVFGVAVAVPKVADRLEAPLSRLARFGPKSVGRGFWSGIAVGAALGFVYAPCAGPILAAVVSVSAASGRTVAVGLAYSLGSAVVLLILALAGRAVLDRVRRAGRGPGLQRALGAVMVLTALAMALQLDVRFQSAIANHLPAAVVNPTESLEASHTVSDGLDKLRGRSRFENAAKASKAKPAPAGGADADASTLPDYGMAPEFTGITHWINSEPLTLASLRGHVVLVDFWTYTCINCIRTLPHVEAWDAAYRKDGLTIIGVHSPEFSFEHETSNVTRAVKQDGIKYPVAQDNDLATWNAWSNQYWPAEYLIDAKGHVRHANFGEGDAAGTESAIRSLLKEAGATDLGADAKPKTTYDPAQQTSPETYLGLEREDGFQPPGKAGTSSYVTTKDLPLNSFSFGGTWKLAQENATAGIGATLTAHVQGKDVYLVLSPPAGGAGSVRVLLDGKPIPAADAGGDVHNGVVKVTTQRLYHLVSRPTPEQHLLQLQFSPGVAGFAFTFG